MDLQNTLYDLIPRTEYIPDFYKDDPFREYQNPGRRKAATPTSTSIPTYVSLIVVISCSSLYNQDKPTLAWIRPLTATQLFGLSFWLDTAVVLRDGLEDLMTIGLPCLA